MLGAGPRVLDDSRQIFDSTLAHHLVKSCNRILLEVGSGSMLIKRLAVFVLLIDEDCVGIVLDPVWDIGDATRLLPRGMGQFFEYLRDLLAVFIREAHAYCKADHSTKEESTIKPAAREV